MAGSAQQAQQRGQIAAQSLFTAASAANAIPVAGQFVSAGLAIAGLFTKLFAGKRKAKRERAREAERVKRQQIADKQLAAPKNTAVGGGEAAGGQQASPISATINSSGPVASSYSSWGGGQSPSIQPTQQALNSKLGM